MVRTGETSESSEFAVEGPP